MAREKRDIICGEVVPDFLDLPVTFPFPPLGSPILEPNLSKENTPKSFREQWFMQRSEAVHLYSLSLTLTI